ncbi:MAG: HAMP domain-containing protein [Burkholderiales bacterium]|nr:HAMP domain-containing protein [Burkholderiales bacterium]
MSRLPPAGPTTLAFLAALSYLALGSLWIALSDRLGALLFDSAAQVTRFQTYKGWIFVASTALLIFALMRVSAGGGREQSFPGPSLAGQARRPLSVWLSLLVLATGLPLIALTTYGLHRETEREVSEANRFMTGLADVSAADTSASLEEYGRVAATLARRPLVRELDPARCDSLLAGIRIMRPVLADIATLDAAGNLVCSPTLPVPLVSALGPPPAGPAAPSSARLAAVGPPRQDSAGNWVANLDYRFAGFTAPGVLRLVIRLDALYPMVTSALPEGGTAILVSREGIIVARSSGAGGAVGQKFAGAGHLQQATTRPSGYFTAPGPDGVTRLYAWRIVGQSGWVALAGVPSESVYAGARRAALLSALAAAAILALSAALVILIGRRIAAPMHALTQTAHRVAMGQFDQRATEAGPREVAEVAAGFNHMLDRIPAMEQALRDSEARHRSLVELAPDGIALHQGGWLTYANPGLRHMFGLHADDPSASRPLSERVEPENRELWLQRMARLQAAPGTSPPHEFRMRHDNGTVIDVEETSNSVRMGGGLVTQTHLRDVTARNASRRALERANENLESSIRERTQDLQLANDALESFSYSVAHDLRAPVIAVNGFAHVLQTALAAGETEQAARHAARIAASGATMSRMIEGLLALARAGSGALRTEIVDMQALVKQVIAELGADTAAQVTVGTLPALPAHLATVRQVWANLISNAVKYSSRRGRPEVRIDCRTQGEDYLFSVTDNGEGFDPALAGRLFAVFSRLPGSEGFEGTGVGLAVVKRVVERHGGRAWAEGRPGKGATLFFTLPAAGRR